MADGTEERLSKLEGNVNKILSAVEGSGGGSGNNGGGKTPPGVDAYTDAELEQLSRKDLVQVIQNSFQQNFARLEQQLNDAISDTKNEVSNSNIRNELREVAARYPEIRHLKEPLKAMVEENPDLSVERMVNLIKAEQPEAYEEAVQKVKQEADDGSDGSNKDGGDGSGGSKEGDGDEGGENKSGSTKEGSDGSGDKGGDKKGTAKGGGGLPPGGDGAGSGTGDDTSEGKQSPKEAANAAWDELFGSQDSL